MSGVMDVGLLTDAALAEFISSPTPIDVRVACDKEMQRRSLERRRDGTAEACNVGDPVDHPAHYKAGGLESIDVIEAFGLGFNCGNAVKYILRAGRKGGPGKRGEDLAKARWYLDREIGREGRK